MYQWMPVSDTSPLPSSGFGNTQVPIGYDFSTWVDFLTLEAGDLIVLMMRADGATSGGFVKPMPTAVTIVCGTGWNTASWEVEPGAFYQVAWQYINSDGATTTPVTLTAATTYNGKNPAFGFEVRRFRRVQRFSCHPFFTPTKVATPRFYPTATLLGIPDLSVIDYPHAIFVASTPNHSGFSGSGTLGSSPSHPIWGTRALGHWSSSYYMSGGSYGWYGSEMITRSWNEENYATNEYGNPVGYPRYMPGGSYEAKLDPVPDMEIRPTAFLPDPRYLGGYMLYLEGMPVPPDSRWRVGSV